jgi:hypothetical protein
MGLCCRDFIIEKLITPDDAGPFYYTPAIKILSSALFTQFYSLETLILPRKAIVPRMLIFHCTAEIDQLHSEKLQEWNKRNSLHQEKHPEVKQLLNMR